MITVHAKMMLQTKYILINPNKGYFSMALSKELKLKCHRFSIINAEKDNVFKNDSFIIWTNLKVQGSGYIFV